MSESVATRGAPTQRGPDIPKGVKILVTGAAGMLGSDVVRAAEFVNHEVVGVARSELDVTDRQAVTRMLLQERPAAVVNCAAYTDVDGSEDDLGGAMDVNAEGAASKTEERSSPRFECCRSNFSVTDSFSVRAVSGASVPLLRRTRGYRPRRKVT